MATKAGNSAGRIRATTEVNFKSSMVAFVFGEDERVINPGDLLLVMTQSEPGDRNGANCRKFEISVSGSQMAGLLDQVTRASDLFMANIEWLKTPASRAATPLTPAAENDRDLNRLATHLKHVKGYVPTLALDDSVIPLSEKAKNLINAIGQ
jgi:hypothetical protein